MPKKILVVEDEADLRKVLANKLKRRGFAVSEAADGQAGLEQVVKNKPDLILLDILMPVMDGIAMLKELRKIDEELPVYILSNLSDQGKISEALGLKSYKFFVKVDYSLDEIVEKIENHFN